MIFEVHLLAFADDLIRQVDVPVLKAVKVKHDKKSLLESIFYYGQNDFQNVPGYYSVSVGDVIKLPTDDDFEYHMVDSLGFKELTKEQFEEYKTLSIEERMMLRLRKTDV